MVKYLIDTTVLIDHLRGNPQAAEFLAKEHIFISPVTVAELIQGSKNKQNQKKLERLVNQYEIIWISAKINKLAIKLLSKYFLSNNLQFLDAVIVATAIEEALVLTTANLKHFKFIPMLKSISQKKAFTK